LQSAEHLGKYFVQACKDKRQDVVNVIVDDHQLKQKMPRRVVRELFDWGRQNDSKLERRIILDAILRGALTDYQVQGCIHSALRQEKYNFFIQMIRFPDLKNRLEKHTLLLVFYSLLRKGRFHEAAEVFYPGELTEHQIVDVLKWAYAKGYWQFIKDWVNQDIIRKKFDVDGFFCMHVVRPGNEEKLGCLYVALSPYVTMEGLQIAYDYRSEMFEQYADFMAELEGPVYRYVAAFLRLKDKQLHTYKQALLIQP
jgi:hypothetical protein